MAIRIEPILIGLLVGGVKGEKSQVGREEKKMVCCTCTGHYARREFVLLA
jgi:hypothetical protein